MPTYGYRCDNGHEFEVIQKIADETLTTACVECGAPVQRVYHPIAVHFKGSGFYTTDYARKKAASTTGKDGDSSTAGKEGDSKSDGAPKKPDKDKKTKAKSSD